MKAMYLSRARSTPHANAEERGPRWWMHFTLWPLRISKIMVQQKDITHSDRPAFELNSS